MDRPTIFLSSTVFDFADLRGALKDYLELRGCRVLASEFTDFTRPLDKHSYEACLETIEQADLFVLLIGRRIGGWFDEPNQISITRAEFRHAYKLAQQGRIRILCFVRSDVWDHRQSVRDLERALKQDSELNDQQRTRLANHPTLAMDNATAIISFIDEVAKNNETARAVKGLGEAPIANWIWPFSTFSQVRQALDPLILHGLTVQDAAGRKALEKQLHQMLQNIVPLVQGAPLNPINSVLNLRTTLNLQSEMLTQTIILDEKRWSRLASLLVHSQNVNADTSSISAHLSSSLLLNYDPGTGTFKQTDEYDLLVHVIDQATMLEKSGRPDLADFLKFGRPANATGIRMVPAHLVVAWVHRLLRWVDLIGSLRALARSLSGKPLVKPAMVPQTPIVDQEEVLTSEAVSLEQIRQFVNE